MLVALFGLVLPAVPAAQHPKPGLATIRSVRHSSIPNGVRITIELDAEVQYHEEHLENPRRLFFDLKNADAVPGLRDAIVSFNDGIVRNIRLGRHQNTTTRLVIDLEDDTRCSVFSLYDPFRLIIDCEREDPDTQTNVAHSLPAPPATLPAVPFLLTSTLPSASESGLVALAATLESEETAARPTELVPQEKAAPDKNASSPEIAPAVVPPKPAGAVSLARQLGLGVSRIVIDPGHGGYDPGAKGTKLLESDLVLDIALRVEKLLLKQKGFEVVLTRRTNVFVPLEERTAIANRKGADLFLSIHANASRNSAARGVETYFLNFATTPDSAAVAARENAESTGTMHNLTDIVRAITLNNKLDESRDFADEVQQSIVRRLRASNKQLRNLGVKQAPFVVLVDAGMPAVLTEISFITNRDEARLLRSSSYRQKIAQALLEAIVRYQRSLKNVGTVAHQ